MIKQLLKNLILTFIISSLLGVIALIINHHFHDFVDFDSDLNGLLEFTVQCYGILAILSLPAILLSKASIRTNPVLRIVIYYAGSVISLIFFIVMTLRVDSKHAEDWLMEMIIIPFIMIHTFFYINLVKKGFINT